MEVRSTADVAPRPCRVGDPTLMLAEQEHRSRNVLQLIGGVLGRAAAASGGETASTLRAVEAQVHSFGLLEAALSTAGAGPLSTTCCVAFLERLCAHLEKACLAPLGITLTLSSSSGLHLDERRCRYLGLGVTEAVLNAAKHAFTDLGGAVHVDVSNQAGAVLVAITDNGAGMPDVPPQAGHGRGYIERLMRSVGGSMSYTPRTSGTRVELAVPELVEPAGSGA